MIYFIYQLCTLLYFASKTYKTGQTNEIQYRFLHAMLAEKKWLVSIGQITRIYNIQQPQPKWPQNMWQVKQQNHISKVNKICNQGQLGLNGLLLPVHHTSQHHIWDKSDDQVDNNNQLDQTDNGRKWKWKSKTSWNCCACKQPAWHVG